MEKVKKIPMRQCLGCNEHKPKKELIRLVRTPEGEVVADMTGKKNGRGAYLCPSDSCLRRVQKSKRAEKVLECAIPDEVYEAVARALAEDKA
jgi:predicted RNA-binding protein YlxR (DUF448 family)